MFRRFLICCLVLSGFLYSNEAFAEDECPKNPRACFEFDKDDKVITESGEPERTFSFPPVKTGFVVDFRNLDVLPYLGVQMFDFSLPKVGDFSVDAGVAPSRLFVSLNWELIPIVKAGPMIWGGVNIKEKESAFGVGLTILNF